MTTQFKILPAYSSLFYSNKPYHFISGGRASGKSTQVALYFIMKLVGDDYFRGVVSRYTLTSIKTSIFQDIMDLIKNFKLSTYLELKGDVILNKENGNMILTHSVRIADGFMDAKSKGLSNVSHLIIDEATELPSQDEYYKLVDSFRYKNAERKIFLCFNPTNKNHWLFKRFYLPTGEPNPVWFEDHNFIHTTYKDNKENIDPRKIDEWERMETIDPDYFNNQILGHWRDMGEGQILRNWNFGEITPDPEARKTIGLDFGFYPDPSAIVEVYRKSNRLWIKELFYGTNKTNQDLVEILKNKGITNRDLILADSAEPKSIEEIRRAGFNIQHAIKGPDSIRWGIGQLNSCEVFCDTSSKNIINEYANWTYKAGTGIPIDRFNHTIDAIRYAISKDKPKITIYNNKNYQQEDLYS